jgi:hypothetical protein
MGTPRRGDERTEKLLGFLPWPALEWLEVADEMLAPSIYLAPEWLDVA